MLRPSLIALALAAGLAVASSDAAEDTFGPGAEPSEPALSDSRDPAALPERRRRRPPQRRYHGAEVVPGYGVRDPVDFYSGAAADERNDGRPPREAPAPSPRGLHNGLWYY
jgi:hypothetical protein